MIPFAETEISPPSNPVPRITPKARTAARQKALQALYQWMLTRDPPDYIENQFMTEEDMQYTDLAYFKDLLHNVVAHHDALNDAIRPYLDRAIEQLDPIEHSILQIGSYELIHRLDVPWRVVINESVELAKRFGAEKSHKYVNGILDKLAHHQLKIQQQNPTQMQFANSPPTF